MNYRKWGSGDPRAVDRVMHGCICDADVAMLHGALELPKYGQEVFSVKSRMVQLQTCLYSFLWNLGYFEESYHRTSGTHC